MSMVRWFLSLSLVLFAFCAVAEEPLVEIEFDETSTIPGQPLILRVTVLVPTWLPKPVVFPSFEAPNVLVQRPESATSPVSREVEGETWSGVSRRLTISPMIPGTFEIPAQQLIVTWAEPGQTDPLEKTMTLDPIRIEGIVPEGAEDLDPFLAAGGLSLTREGADIKMPLKAGDSLTLTVTAQIEGTAAMFLPELIPSIDIDGVAAYRAEPVLVEHEDRGKRSGTRAETLSLVAESGGAGAVPEISLRWYNISSKKVETARLEGFDVSVDAPVAQGDRISAQRMAAYAVAATLVFLALVFVAHWILPKIHVIRAARRSRFEASEAFAFAQLNAAVTVRDIGETYRTFDIWAARAAGNPAENTVLKSAFSDLGAALYGAEKTKEDVAWAGLFKALNRAQSTSRHSAIQSAQLPPLNPQNVL
ncbi:MAG: hypothetical protein AB8B62_04465 [Roseobacter sp.]